MNLFILAKVQIVEWDLAPHFYILKKKVLKHVTNSFEFVLCLCKEVKACPHVTRLQVTMKEEMWVLQGWGSRWVEQGSHG